MFQDAQVTTVSAAEVASVQLTHTGNTIGWVSAYDAGGQRVYAHGPVRFQEAAAEWQALKQTYPQAEALELSTDR